MSTKSPKTPKKHPAVILKMFSFFSEALAAVGGNGDNGDAALIGTLETTAALLEFLQGDHDDKGPRALA